MKTDKDTPELKAYSLVCLNSVSKAFYTKAKGEKDKRCPDCLTEKSFWECIVAPEYIVCEVCGYRNIYTDMP